MTAVTFVHLTDLHISHPDMKEEALATDTIGTLRAVIGMVNAIDPKPSFVAISGDLTNQGDVASYRFLREMLAAIDIPLVYALGNHDTRAGFYAGILDRNDAGEAPYCHDTVIDGVHVVTLDTSIAGKIGGGLSEEQFAFLDGALDRHRDLPRVIVMHHAPLIDEERGYGWQHLGSEESARLRASLQGKGVAGVFTGHIHYDRVSFWHGIPVIVGGGHQNAVDPTYGQGLRIRTGGSFAVCTLRQSGLTVSFVPLPSDRRELRIVPDARARSYV